MFHKRVRGTPANPANNNMTRSSKMAATTVIDRPGFFDKERIVADAGYSRWLVPPCALAIHLCIGMAYGFSVFWLPLHRAVGLSKPLECAENLGFFGTITPPSCD